MLEGMPGPGSLRLLAHEGEAVVLSGRWVLFRFPVADTGMRRLAMVALTEAGHPVKTVATVFGVHPNYLSTLRKTAREQGSGGLVKAMGRPVKLSAAQLARARRWVEQGMTGQEIARRLDVSDTMISRLVSADRRRPEPVRDELPDPELLDPELPDPALVDPVDAEPDPVDADRWLSGRWSSGRRTGRSGRGPRGWSRPRWTAVTRGRCCCTGSSTGSARRRCSLR
jgi:transposase